MLISPWNLFFWNSGIEQMPFQLCERLRFKIGFPVIIFAERSPSHGISRRNEYPIPSVAFLSRRFFGDFSFEFSLKKIQFFSVEISKNAARGRFSRFPVYERTNRCEGHSVNKEPDERPRQLPKRGKLQGNILHNHWFLHYAISLPDFLFHDFFEVKRLDLFQVQFPMLNRKTKIFCQIIGLALIPGNENHFFHNS